MGWVGAGPRLGGICIFKGPFFLKETQTHRGEVWVGPSPKGTQPPLPHSADPHGAPAPTPSLLISPCFNLPQCLYTLPLLEASPRQPEPLCPPPAQEVPQDLPPQGPAVQGCQPSSSLAPDRDNSVVSPSFPWAWAKVTLCATLLDATFWLGCFFFASRSHFLIVRLLFPLRRAS